MTSPLLVIGNKNYSSWSLRPWLLLRHFALDFHEHRVALFTHETEAELKPLSPNMKVPVLHHQQRVIWDSLAICEYINEQFLDDKGWPVDAGQRGLARSICAEIHSGLNALRTYWPMNCRLRRKLQAGKELAADIGRVDDLWRQCLNNTVAEGGYLFGRFSIADAFYAPVVLRFHSYQPELSAQSQAYMDKMLSNKALQEWIAAGREEKEVIDEDEVDWLAQRHPAYYQV